jgi:hypothetical protein
MNASTHGGSIQLQRRRKQAAMLKTMARPLLPTYKEMIMAGSRHPGPLGASGNHPIIDSGTLASVANPLSGPTGLNARC